MPKVELDLEDAKKLLNGYEKCFNDLWYAKGGSTNICKRTFLMRRLADAIYKVEKPELVKKSMQDSVEPDTIVEQSSTDYNIINEMCRLEKEAIVSQDELREKMEKKQEFKALQGRVVKLEKLCQRYEKNFEDIENAFRRSPNRLLNGFGI